MLDCEVEDAVVFFLGNQPHGQQKAKHIDAVAERGFLNSGVFFLSHFLHLRIQG